MVLETSSSCIDNNSFEGGFHKLSLNENARTNWTHQNGRIFVLPESAYLSGSDSLFELHNATLVMAISCKNQKIIVWFSKRLKM